MPCGTQPSEHAGDTVYAAPYRSSPPPGGRASVPNAADRVCVRRRPPPSSARTWPRKFPSMGNADATDRSCGSHRVRCGRLRLPRPDAAMCRRHPGTGRHLRRIHDRLANLSYEPGGCRSRRSPNGVALVSAVQEFQSAPGLTIDGDPRRQNQAALAEVCGA